MGGPNEPRRMTPRGNSADAREFDNTTGDAGRDGFSRIARRTPRGRDGGNDNPFMFGGDGAISPQVGERDWNRGPRFDEDY